MPTLFKVKVGDVASFTAGYGFNITNEYGAPLLSISYNTLDDAKEAHLAITAALENAVEIVSHTR